MSLLIIDHGWGEKDILGVFSTAEEAQEWVASVMGSRWHRDGEPDDDEEVDGRGWRVERGEITRRRLHDLCIMEMEVRSTEASAVSTVETGGED